MVRCGAAVGLVFFLILSSPCLAAPDYVSRPGTVPYTLALPNGVEVTLDNVVVELIIGSYLFVRDPWNQVLLPVYAITYVERWTSVEVTGVTATVSGKRILEATRVRQYVDFRGRPMLMLPKGTSQPYPWSNMRELALGRSLLDGPSDPPEPIPPSVNRDPLTTEGAGTIGYAKRFGLTEPLVGKVVTAVFRRVGNATIDFFYIQEQDCPSGIKVVPPASAWEVEAGDVVTVEGTVVGGDSVAECYIDADDVDITGTAPIPAPLGMTNKATAGGEFGDQQALYLDSSDANKVGSGLNAVGTRVRVWGSLVMAGGLDHYIDDGSRLFRTLSPTQERVVGLRIESWEGYSMPTYISTRHIVATGILGAEIDGGSLPVPVVRIPGPPPRCAVKVAKPGTGGWPGAYETIQNGINAAAGQNPKGEVWVADGIYEENIVVPDGVAVYGGFGGREDKREQRMIHAFPCPTVIDGGNTGPVVAVVPNATPATRIDGFTIRNGALITDGAGIACGSGASPTIANNYIAHNNTALGNGAGVWSYGGSPCIWSSWIHSNNDIPGAPQWGGGIFCQGGSPVILFNLVEANYAGHGAGICCTAGR